MKTKELYYEEALLASCEARVLELRRGGEGDVVILDRSLFYPEGGGQPCDLGRIAGLELASVESAEGLVLHKLKGPAGPGLEPGALVRLELDETRRKDHREQHSGQHLLSASLLRLFGAATKSFHLGAERSTIDVDGPFIDSSMASEAELFVNGLIADNYAFSTHLCPPEDLDSFPLRRRPPSGEEVIRIVEIDGIDFTPCCGTHARSSGELRLLLVLGTEKYKGMTRVEFAVGERALAIALASVRAAREASKVLGCTISCIGSESSGLATRFKASQAALRAFVRERAKKEAETLVAGSDGGPIVVDFPDRDAEAALEACKALAERGRTGIAASRPELVACAVAPGGGASLALRLGPLAAALGGKGGGGPAFFRASFPGKAELGEFLDRARENLQN